MASNFFEQQDVARKKTVQLMVLFAAAVGAITLLTYLLAIAAYHMTGMAKGDTPVPYLGLFAMVAVGVMTLVGCCSLYKVVALRSGGGESVAQSLGGRLLHPDTADRDERKILNVVEEMALASGTPVPPVYLMEREGGINAFAAGYAPDRAVIGITRGAIEQLSREELQGVVAHEFSHILNGDMRMNIRLMGVLFGILAIAVIGRVILEGVFWSGGTHRRRSGNKDSGGGVLVVAVVAIGLLVIGYVGVFFGKLIQAAVSRQREYLADASAVQFTRNPDSIGGALKRIGGYSSFVGSSHADEASHMFIAKSSRMWANGPFATHPPIQDRIKRIDPSWDGTYPEPIEHGDRRPKRKPEPKLSPPPLMGEDANPLGGMVGAVITAGAMAEAGQQQANRRAPVIEEIGQITPAHVDYMRELLAAIPESMKEAAHETYGARAVVYAVLLDQKAEVRNTQLAHLTKHADRQVVALTQKLMPEAAALRKEARLPLIDMAVPALREMSDHQYADFAKSVDALIKADGRVELFEWALERLLLHHLDTHFTPSPDPKPKYYSLKPVLPQCSTLLSVLSHVGNPDANEAAAAFAQGRKALGLQGLSLMTRKQANLKLVGQALDELAYLSLREKRKLIEACSLVIAADGAVTRGEGELMRAVADSLGVPMPPLLPGQTLV